jgi:hypothetical protein
MNAGTFHETKPIFGQVRRTSTPAPTNSGAGRPLLPHAPLSPLHTRLSSSRHVRLGRPRLSMSTKPNPPRGSHKAGLSPHKNFRTHRFAPRCGATCVDPRRVSRPALSGTSSIVTIVPLRQPDLSIVSYHCTQCSLASTYAFDNTAHNF